MHVPLVLPSELKPLSGSRRVDLDHSPELVKTRETHPASLDGVFAVYPADVIPGAVFAVDGRELDLCVCLGHAHQTVALWRARNGFFARFSTSRSMISSQELTIFWRSNVFRAQARAWTPSSLRF